MAEEQQEHTIFQEIDDALRADRMAALWSEHRSTIIGCCVALVLGTAASAIWRNYSDHKAEEATLHMAQAQDLYDAGKYAEAADAFGKIAQDYSKEASLARLKQAQALTSAGQADKAAAVKAGGDKGLSALLTLQSAERGAADESALRAQAQTGKPFDFSAKELLALKLMQEGKSKESAELFTQLQSDPEAPATLRMRAGQVLQAMEDKQP